MKRAAFACRLQLVAGMLQTRALSVFCVDEKNFCPVCGASFRRLNTGTYVALRKV